MDTPKIAQRGPYPVDVEDGKRYWWCACGHSEQQPWCSGAHKGGPYSPQAFTAESTGTVYLCGCKQTRNPPYCDGSHKTLD